MEVRRRTLILGLGNPLAGDDSFGTRVVEAMRLVPLLHAEAEVAHTDLFPWIDRFGEYDRVILVDALLDPAAALDEVVVLTEVQLANCPDDSPSAHQMSPLLSLRLFRRLNPDARTEVVLVALRTSRIRIDRAGPSPAVVSAAVKAVSRLLF